MKKLFEKLLEKTQKIKEKRIKKIVLYGRKNIFGKIKERGMIRDYERRYQAELILEQWIIQKILEGKTNRRKELAEKQAEIKEIKEFVKYLKKLN